MASAPPARTESQEEHNKATEHAPSSGSSPPEDAGNTADADSTNDARSANATGHTDNDGVSSETESPPLSKVKQDKKEYAVFRAAMQEEVDAILARWAIEIPIVAGQIEPVLARWAIQVQIIKDLLSELDNWKNYLAGSGPKP